jgi:hypothetical protein
MMIRWRFLRRGMGSCERKWVVDLGNYCVQATKWNGNGSAHTQPSPEVPFNYLHIVPR